MFEIGSLPHILLLLPIPCIYYIGNRCKKDITLTLSFLLFVMECLKQCYYLYHHTWTVWIFPFQLCSIPLYYWIFHRYKDYFHGLFESYILLATIVALIYPEDMIHSELILTIHSFLWHYILIFMAANVHSANFKKGTILFLICCGIATLFNITLSSFGEINMFYIHPWIHTTQPILHTIGLKYGILSKNIVYIGSIIFISFGIHKKKTS